MASKRLTFGTLPENPIDGACLICRKCGRTYSCQRSDYFLHPQEESPRCQDCATLLRLARKVTRYVEVSVEQVEQP